MELKIQVFIDFNHVNNGHFVVLRSVNSYYVLIADPATGIRRYTRKQFEKLLGTDDGRVKAMAIVANDTDKRNVNFGYFGRVPGGMVNYFFTQYSQGYIP